jgi:hypothetical protein
MRIIQAGLVISESYQFVSFGPLTGTVGNVPCYASVDSIKRKSLRPRYMNNKPFSVQLLDESGSVLGTFGIATAEQVAAHPAGVVAEGWTA